MSSHPSETDKGVQPQKEPHSSSKLDSYGYEDDDMRYLFAYVQSVPLHEIQRVLKYCALPSYGTKDVLVCRLMIKVRTATSRRCIRTVELFQGDGRVQYKNFLDKNQADTLPAVPDLQDLEAVVRKAREMNNERLRKRRNSSKNSDVTPSKVRRTGTGRASRDNEEIGSSRRVGRKDPKEQDSAEREKPSPHKPDGHSASQSRTAKQLSKVQVIGISDGSDSLNSDGNGERIGNAGSSPGRCAGDGKVTGGDAIEGESDNDGKKTGKDPAIENEYDIVASQFARLLLIIRDGERLRPLFLKHMNSLSRRDTDRGKKSDDFWVDDVEEVFNDPKSNVTVEKIGSFAKGRLRVDVTGPYRSPEELRKMMVEAKGPFSKVMQNFKQSGNEALDTFLDYIKGVPECRTKKNKFSSMGKKCVILFKLIRVGQPDCDHDLLHYFFKETTKKLSTGEIVDIGREGGLTDESDDEVEAVESKHGTPKQRTNKPSPSQNVKSDSELDSRRVRRTSSGRGRPPRPVSRGRRGRLSSWSGNSRQPMSYGSEADPVRMMNSALEKMDKANEIQMEDQKRRRELDDVVKTSIKTKSVNVDSRNLHTRKMEIYTEVKELDTIIKNAKADPEYSKEMLEVHMDSYRVLITKYKSLVAREENELE